MSAVTLVHAQSAAHWQAARALVLAYARSLDVDLTFQGIDDELTNLEAHYGSSGSVFVLASQGNTYIGCGAIRRRSAEDCEMKRLYVIPAAQRLGIGRTIALALIDHARTLGYRTMRLDSLPTMRGAHALYRSLGFEPTAAYTFNPTPGVTFMKLEL